MMNQIIIVGRLVERPVIEETENGRKSATITMALPRHFRNDDGEYETDFVPVSLVGQVAEATYEYCEKGDLIGVKGRLARLNGSDLQVIGEKVTFLSQRKKEEE